MNKNKNDYFGICINDKIPKIDNKLNKYYKSINLDFEGKVFILKKNKLDIKEELETGKKYKKSGEHTIKFINKDNELYYINIKICRLWFIWLFLFAFLILISSVFFFYKMNNIPFPKQIIEDTVSYDMQMDGLKYVFDIDYENENFKSVELTDKVTNQKVIYPGSSGSFYIIISTKNGNKDMLYQMQVKEETSKPKNLKFKVNDNIYNSVKELSQAINGSISKNSTKTLKIDWFWDYDTNDDIIDTFDGINNKNYSFLMTIIGTTKGG